ncbi:parathyroid hormone/parathyroid hormone-related peptide receptor-like isoform X2 [Tachypleus tridentatus]|uniref:parathyroid hormone/parathyroid hormone-related peptide receptor-like isoform X2 n=1 Tax=Tachypleus tridentatus TaxID=6853 RepID=UPI003FD62762
MASNASFVKVSEDDLQQHYMDQQAKLEEKRMQCEAKMIKMFPLDGGLYCPMIWDGAICWPYTPAGTLHEISCPSYVHGFNTEAFASKLCTNDGTWWLKKEFNQTWTNFSMCVTHFVDQQGETEDLELNVYSNGFFEPHISTIKLISKVGYTISFSALVVAFLILAFLRKIRCPRNKLHMQLFLSFIMRALMFLLKDSLFITGMGLQSNVKVSIGGVTKFMQSRSNIDCKLFTSFWHYFLMANYSWILMEGLYLHNLIFLAMFTDNNGITIYVVMGWGLPILFIIPWVVVRVLLEDTLCWTTNDNLGYFWIIRAPITTTIIVNFIFFVNVTRVLFLKIFVTLRSQPNRYGYRKWFRSTLVLVPLFGVHYAVLLGMSFSADVNRTVEVIWLYIDMLFSSFQGFFVGLLYCFCNGEVQQELRKLWHHWWIENSHSIRSHQSILTQSLTYLSRGRSSVQSFHSCSALDNKGIWINVRYEGLPERDLQQVVH